MFQLIVLQTLNGLQLGVLLFLVAAGLTLIFGVMGLLNLAHASLYTLGAYVFASLATKTDSVYLSVFLTCATMFAIGVVLEVIVFKRLRERSHLEQVLGSFGLILVFNESAKMVWGAAPIGVSLPAALEGSFSLVGALHYPIYRALVIAVGLVVGLGLLVLVNYTRLGMLLRAGASNQRMVSALGFDVRPLFMFIVGLGAMLAGLAGAIVAPLTSVEPGIGDSILIPAFVVIVIGGVGSVRGSFIAAIALGLVDTLGRSFGPILLSFVMEPSSASQVGRTITPMLIYIMMATVLFFRPAGLFPAYGKSR